MTPSATPDRYKHHRFPAEIISHDVWLYFRFCLSYRDVEELLCTRGILVTYEAIWKWLLLIRINSPQHYRRLSLEAFRLDTDLLTDQSPVVVTFPAYLLFDEIFFGTGVAPGI